MYKIVTFIFVVLSLNLFSQSGISWNSTTSISTGVYSNMHPRIALDAKGNPLVIWGRMSDESIFFSRWTGSAFTTPVKLNPAWLTVATASWMGPEIASHGDTVYVVVKRTPEALDTNHIYLIRSFNGGQTFSAPVRVDYIADSISRFPTVTTDVSGNPIIAFMKFNAAFADSRWVVLKSTDYGSTFTADVKASGWNNSAEVCDCCPGTVLSNGNLIAMLYRNNKNNIRDTYVGFSTNNGNSFSNGLNADNKNWMFMSCPASGPDGVVLGDTLYSVFLNGNGGFRNYLSKTSLLNLSFVSTTNVTGAIAGLTQQNYPAIAGNGNALAIVWKQIVSGKVQLPILFTNDVRKGLPKTYDTVALDNITNADIALGKGSVFVVWEDDNTGTVNFRKGNFNPFATGVEENKIESNFYVNPNPANNFVAIETNADCNLIHIRNTLGQMIFSKEIPKNQHQFQLEISNWPTGIYFITLQFKNSSLTKKLIKE